MPEKDIVPDLVACLKEKRNRVRARQADGLLFDDEDAVVARFNHGHGGYINKWRCDARVEYINVRGRANCSASLRIWLSGYLCV